jgi:hypothetical protein
MDRFPNAARTSSTTRTRASPLSASMLRSSTSRRSSPGYCNASRHSTTPPADVTQRLRQIKVPGS